MRTGPGLPLSAIANANGTARISSFALFTIIECFVIGNDNPNVSASWNASVPMSERFT